MTLQLNRLVLRYGVFLLLALMSAGLLCFVHDFELRVKAPVHLFHDGHDRSWIGYVPVGQKDARFQPNDTLVVVQTPMGDIPYIVESVTPETGMLRLKLILVTHDSLFTNSYCEGFVYIGREKIMNKILH